LMRLDGLVTRLPRWTNDIAATMQAQALLTVAKTFLF
jgi:hypothetical protein